MAGRSRAIRPEFPRSDCICKFFSWMQLYAPFYLESWNLDTPVIPIGTPPHSSFTFWKKKCSSESSQINSHCHSTQFILPSREHIFIPPKNSAIIFKSIKLFNKSYIYTILNKNSLRERSKNCPEIKSYCQFSQCILPSHEHSSMCSKKLDDFILYQKKPKFFARGVPKIAHKLNRIANF